VVREAPEALAQLEERARQAREALAELVAPQLRAVRAVLHTVEDLQVTTTRRVLLVMRTQQGTSP
jgi:hypothetical protein